MNSDDVIAIPPENSLTVSFAIAGKSTQSVPGNVEEWAQQESLSNGLSAGGLQPWHLVMEYDEFDEDGDNVHSGVIDELWATPRKYRLSYKADNLNETDFATDHGLFRAGDQRWPNPAESQALAEVVDPFHYAAGLTGFKTKSVERSFGAHTLNCVLLQPTDGRTLPLSTQYSTQYCFDANGNALRYVRGQGWDESTYNDILSFQGRYVARDVEVWHGDKRFLKLHVKTLEPLTSIPEADLIPPGDAANVAAGRVSGVRLTAVHIENPTWTGSLREQSFHIKLAIVVGKDGHVIEAHAISGPTDAYKAAEATARKWVFRPYLVLGSPVEVSANIEMQNN
jgi:hypothetical protein